MRRRTVTAATVVSASPAAMPPSTQAFRRGVPTEASIVIVPEVLGSPVPEPVSWPSSVYVVVVAGEGTVILPLDEALAPRGVEGVKRQHGGVSRNLHPLTDAGTACICRLRARCCGGAGVECTGVVGGIDHRRVGVDALVVLALIEVHVAVVEHVERRDTELLGCTGVYAPAPGPHVTAVCAMFDALVPASKAPPEFVVWDELV